MKANCLTRSLDQWEENTSLYRLWYNSSHVICIEGYYDAFRLFDYSIPNTKYLPLTDFGYDYFCISFNLAPKYRKLLKEYFDKITK